MGLTDELKTIVSQRQNVTDVKIFLLKNDKPEKMKILPSTIGMEVIDDYFEKIEFQIRDKEVVNYIPDVIDKETLQVIETSNIAIWNNIIKARNEMPLINVSEITVEDYNTDNNTVLVEITLENEDENLYFLICHKKVFAWYRNGITFHKKQNGHFERGNGEVFVLIPFVDVIIKGNKCYILNENNFNKIFKYDEVITNQVNAKIDEIKSLKFIADSDSFVKMLNNSKNEKKAMAKVLQQKRIEKINGYTPEYIRQQIESQEELNFIQFNEDNTIQIDKKSFKAIMGILKGKINLDLITRELNGVENNE
ncbi:MAG: DUF4868 domain-containing protein [Clostridia bacterium]|nr:DUF4868 domain-containing protein [Clostridia bacterium]